MKLANIGLKPRKHGLVTLHLGLLLIPILAYGGFSGDLVLDGTLGTGYKVRAGGSGPGIDRGSNVVACNSAGAPSMEQQCPNDATYTPAAATGGYQAWAVGVAQIFGEGQPEIDCFVVPIIDWWGSSIQISFVTVCVLVPTVNPLGTWGNAMARLKWGQSTSGTAQYSAYPTSVMAFHERSLDECHPMESINAMEAECFDNSDSSYVADSGYEAKIVISDSACQAGTRSGDDDDLNSGCFYYHRSNMTQITDLPAPYKDTTLGDSGSVFIIGFGSADAADIDPGHTYTVKQFFTSKAQPVMLQTNGMHVGSITTEIPLGVACLVGLGEDNMCFYSIDQANVGGATGDKFERVHIL